MRDGCTFARFRRDAIDALRRVGRSPSVIILQMRRVPFPDVSGVTAVAELVPQTTMSGAQVIAQGAAEQLREMRARAGPGRDSGYHVHVGDFAEALAFADIIAQEHRSVFAS